MMEVPEFARRSRGLDALKIRRSVRRYTGESISRKDLETIVDAGRLAASGGNRQPWDFVVVTEKSTIRQLPKVADWMDQAAAIIVVVVDASSPWWMEDGAAAAENLLIAGAALGHGACWLSGYEEEGVKTLLGIPDGKRVFALVSIGVPAIWTTIEKRALDEVIHWEKYRQP